MHQKALDKGGGPGWRIAFCTVLCHERLPGSFSKLEMFLWTDEYYQCLGQLGLNREVL